MKPVQFSIQHMKNVRTVKMRATKSKGEKGKKPHIWKLKKFEFNFTVIQQPSEEETPNIGNNDKLIWLNMEFMMRIDLKFLLE